jgi:preprotein translocase subunit SecG
MNNFLSNLLDDAVISDFATNVLPVLRYVLFGIIMVAAVIMIITTLMQSSDSNGGLDAFSGTKQESYYSQNKGASKDSILKRITIAMAVVICVFVITFFVTELIAGV